MIFSTHSAAKYLAGQLRPRARRRFERHAKHCCPCARAVETSRALAERMRQVTVPAPSADLAARIIANGADGPAAERRPETGAALAGGGTRTAPELGVASGAWSRMSAVIGSAAVIVLTMISGIYVVGAGNDPAALAGRQADPSWNRAVSLTTMEPVELADLRSAGWNCPELAILGFRMESARAYETNGVPTVELRLAQAEATLTINEQRKPKVPAAYRPNGGELVLNGATGRAAFDDGFVPLNARTIEAAAIENSPVAAGSAPLDAEASTAELWVRHAGQWEIIIDMNAARYTLRSDMPILEVASAVAQVASSEHARLASAGNDHARADGLFDRVRQGLAARLISGR